MKYLSILPLLLGLCLSFSSCEGELDVSPDKGPSKLPKFNFLVRQIESSKMKIDTIMVDNVQVINTTIVMDTIKAELYLKQLDYTADDEKYRLVVTLPANFDGLMHYKGAIYRSGDWIEIQYKDLVEHATVLNITQREKATGVYNLNLVCSDKDENSKSATLAIKVL